MTASKIDWDYWFAFPSVRVWQAAALSLDIDPEKLKAHQGGPPAQDSTLWKDPVLFRGSRMYDEFDKRCRLLGANVGSELTTVSLTIGNESRHRIKLTEVAPWLKSKAREPIASGLWRNLPPVTTASAKEAATAIEAAPATFPPSWINLAQVEARRMHKTSPRLTQATLAKRIHKKFELDDIKGSRGKTLTEATIMREALRGIKY